MKVCLNGTLDTLRGSAWPPSARAVKRSVKSENERDLCFQLLIIFLNKRGGAQWKDCLRKKEEGAGNGRSVCSKSAGLHAACIG